VFSFLQYLLPHHLLSALMHAVARIEWPPVKNFIIRKVIANYKVDMSLAVEENPESYPSFNAFFTRQLKADARPLALGSRLVSPVDGTVSQAGDIINSNIFQAKGHTYTLLELLGGNSQLAEEFIDGQFTTIYLSPRDYHRIHMPANGRLRSMYHVPGRLFSVSPQTTRDVPRLFARNERLVNIFDSDQGSFALIMVGAIFVSSMDTVWAGTVTPKRQRPTAWHYESEKDINLNKGEEMGRFNMGSTVILLFPKNQVKWNSELVPGKELKMGESIAESDTGSDQDKNQE
jgi:phosphatidylserine decarboxylase